MKNLLQRLLLTSVLLASAAFAQTVDPQNVLVRNVYLIDGGDATEGVLVNLLIRDNKLEVVTKDEVPAAVASGG